jgi:hypothetical protein
VRSSAVREAPLLATAVAHHGSASAPARPRASWPAVVSSVLVTAALYTLLYLRNPRFFFIDDRVADAVPKLMDVGRMITAGEWPWLTTAAANSGAHAVEYQNGVFNPLLLALSVPLSRLDDAALGAFLVVLVHALLLTGAAAWLGRLLGLSTPWTVAFAVSCGFQAYTVFWGAAAWLQAVSSFAWFVLAVASSVAFHLEPRRRYGWTLLAATFGAYTTGWPLVIPVLGLFVLAFVVVRLVQRSGARTTGWLAAWYAGGAVCSLVALYPLTTSLQFATRTSSISNENNFNVVPLDALLQFANPGYYAFFNNFGGLQLQEHPHFYVAWFVLPVLAFWRPGRLPPAAAVVFRVALVMLAVTALGSLGPERLGLFRFPTRFLQYFGLFLLMVTAALVVHGRFVVTRRRLQAVMAVIGLLALMSLQPDPDGVVRVVLFAAGVAALTGALYLSTRRREGRPRHVPSGGVVAALGTIGVLLAVALVHPVGRGVDYRFPSDLSALPRLSEQDYTLFYGTYITDDVEDAAGYYAEYHPASTGLMVGDQQINGYSPLGYRAFGERFPMDDQGNFEPGTAVAFSTTDPGTGLSWLELLRVDQVIALRGAWSTDLDRVLSPDWERAAARRYTTVWRHAPYELPGLVSYVSPGVRVDDRQPGCGQRNLRECVAVSTRRGSDGRVVFARLWFPGYTATLDGEPVAVERYADMLVSVTVPPGAAGELVLTYRSPRVRQLGLLAALVVVGLAATSSRYGMTSSWPRRRPRLPTPP